MSTIHVATSVDGQSHVLLLDDRICWRPSGEERSLNKRAEDLRISKSELAEAAIQSGFHTQ